MAIQTSPIPIKIQCGCGQKYAFDVEPIAGRMPGPVACPTCGQDGTSIANTILDQHFPSQPAQTQTPGASVRTVSAVPSAPIARVSSIATSPTTPPSAAAASPVPVERPRLPGQLSHDQALREARSKIMWGDDPAEVAKFLMGHGMKPQEAQGILAPLLIERKESVRKAGFGKIFTGIGMMCVPVVAWIFFSSVGVIPLKLMAMAVAVGLWGAYRVLTGLMMVLSPKGEKGDVADM